MNCFKLGSFGIPYSYSPVIAASESQAKKNKELYKRFLTATKKGFLFCRSNCEEAIAILEGHVPATDSTIDLKQALNASLDAFGSEKNWGIIENPKLQTFFDWLHQNGIEKQRFKAQDINVGDSFR